MPDESSMLIDRKDAFVFWSNNIFQFFLYGDAILGNTYTFVDAIKHYLKQLPEYYPVQKEVKIDIWKRWYLKLQDGLSKIVR